MRCITAEERAMLIDCSEPVCLQSDAATDDEVELMRSLERCGLTRKTVLEDDDYTYEFWPTTARGRLAIACYDATNARVFA